jgi:hypothetical protein
MFLYFLSFENKQNSALLYFYTYIFVFIDVTSSSSPPLISSVAIKSAQAFILLLSGIPHQATDHVRQVIAISAIPRTWLCVRIFVYTSYLCLSSTASAKRLLVPNSPLSCCCWYYTSDMKKEVHANLTEKRKIHEQFPL